MFKQYRTTILLAAVLVVLTLAYFFTGNRRSTVSEADADFAVKDTAAINAITLTEYIANKAGAMVMLRKSPAGWTVTQADQTYPANPFMVEELLNVLHGIQVKSSVNTTAKSDAYNALKNNHIRVDIGLTDSDKTYFIGGPTPDGYGTLALIDRATQPFITELPGFKGYLRPYYRPIFADWREKLAFDAPIEQLKRIEVRYASTANDPKDSSIVIVRSGLNWNLENGGGDTTFINRYLSLYTGKVYALDYLVPKRLNDDTPSEHPSLDSLKRTQPYATLRLTDATGKTTTVRFWSWNADLYYTYREGNEVLMAVQDYVVGRFFIRKRQLLPLK